MRVILTLCLVLTPCMMAGPALRTLPDAEGFILIVGGVLDGIANGVDITQVADCINDSEDAVGDLYNAVQLFEQENAAAAKQAIHDLGLALEFIPASIENCTIAYAEDAADIEHMLSNFENPLSFIYVVGKNLVVNGDEIIDEISAAVADWDSQEWYGFGQSVGEALAHTFLTQSSIVKKINSDSTSTWEATKYPKLAGLRLEDKKQFLGTTMMDLPDYVPKKSYSVDVLATLPTAFDARQQWPDCIHPILNQGDCGSCWAFGTSETLSDRLCISSNGTQNVVLSPQDLVDCSLNMGCSGGYPYSAWLWMEWDGIATLDCVPYVSGKTDAEAACTSTCTADSKPKEKYYTEKLSVSALITANDIMADLYTNGPVESAFLVFEDFMNYKSGVYVHKTGDYVGGHCIKIVGWGVQDGLNYWIVANSWGTDWGLDGFFWIEWGQGLIDLNGMAGLPNLTSQ